MGTRTYLGDVTIVAKPYFDDSDNGYDLSNLHFYHFYLFHKLQLYGKDDCHNNWFQGLRPEIAKIVEQHRFCLDDKEDGKIWTGPRQATPLEALKDLALIQEKVKALVLKYEHLLEEKTKLERIIQAEEEKKRVGQG